MLEWMDFNKIAASRGKRQLLDYPLTVTVPRERLFLTVAALVFVLMMVGAFYGQLMFGVTIDGLLVRMQSDQDQSSVRAELQVTSDIAQRIEPGMLAWVELTLPGGKEVMRGEVIAIVDVTPPKAFDNDSVVERNIHHRVDIAIFGNPRPDLPDGTPCRTQIALGFNSPVALITGQIF